MSIQKETQTVAEHESMKELTTPNEWTRRGLLVSGAAAAAMLLTPPALQAQQKQNDSISSKTAGAGSSVITVKDGTQIYYKDWGAGQPITFSHGWPLSCDAWDAQMLFLVQRGFRVIAHDRRGHGRSSQSSNGNDMDTYADDLAELLDSLNLSNAIMVGHSTGGGEVARYLGRHGSNRVSKAVLIAAVTPYMLQTPDHPAGAPISVFDGLRAGVTNRAEFYKGLAMPFYGFNKPDAKVLQGVCDSFWLQGMMGSVKSQYECVKAFSETDFRGDLAKISIPTLLLQGDADQIVPLQISSPVAAKMLKKPTLKVYSGQPHGLCTTLADQVNADLLAFIKG